MEREFLSSGVGVDHFRSSLEEAQTIIVLQCLDAVKCRAADLYIQPPDWCSCLGYQKVSTTLTNYLSYTGGERKKRVVTLSPVIHVLAAVREPALPGVHELLGGQTGRFVCQGKLKLYTLRNSSPRVMSTFIARNRIDLGRVGLPIVWTTDFLFRRQGLPQASPRE